MKNNNKKKVIQTAFIEVQDGRLEIISAADGSTVELLHKQNDSITYKKRVEIDGRRYKPPKQATALVSSNTLKLAHRANPYSSLKDLKRDIQAFIERYLDVPESFGLICTNYVLLSWQYDQFNEIPYLRVRGDYGSGKSRFLSVVGSLTYNPVFASGASTVAPIFHLMDTIRGTLILDESDYRHSDATAEITKILNNGHAKGFNVLRCEPVKDGGFVARAYNVFGPKLVASRESFSDFALESRFITCDLDGREVRKDIPVTLPPSFEQEAVDLRNQLMWYRLHRVFSVSDFKQSIGLSQRSHQILLPLLVITDSDDERREMATYLKDQETQLRSERGLQTEAELLQIIQILECNDELLSLSEITHAFMVRYGSRYSRRITPKWIGYLLRSRLHLATRKHCGVYIISEGQSDRLATLYRKYDVSLDEPAPPAERP